MQFTKLKKAISKLMKFLLRRMVMVGALIVLQLTWLIYMAQTISDYSKWLEWAFRIISIGVVIYIVNKTENPAYKLAWIIPILIFPLFGGLLYLIFGNKKPARKLRTKLEIVLRDTKALLVQNQTVMEKLKGEDLQVASQAAYINDSGGYPIYQNSNANYYPSGESMFEDLKQDLKKAKHFIFMEFFIVEQGTMWNSILEILKERVNDGVEVRFMYDDVGCVDLLPYRYYKDLEKYGISCVAFNPIIPFVSTAWNNRDHRKVVVIDGHIAYTGGLNLADEYINQKPRFGYWKDAGLRVVGDAVWNFTMMFLQVWNSIRKTDTGYGMFLPHGHHKREFVNDGFIQPYADNPLDKEVVGENVYRNIISAATSYVYIFTPYLIIDNEMMSTLCLAAKRGVDVRIVTPDIPDKPTVFLLTQSYYRELVESGVKIYQYTPGFIHAKCFVSDDKVATVGTINMDFRSLYLHFENGVFLYNSAAVMQVKQDALKTFEESRQITEKMCEKNIIQRLAQSILRVFAPLV